MFQARPSLPILLFTTFVALVPAALAQVTLTITPASGYSGASPIKFTGTATTTSAGGVSSFALTQDGTQIFFQYANNQPSASFTAYLWMKAGAHTVVATATDAAGKTAMKTLKISSTRLQGKVANINQWSPWTLVTGSSIGGGGGAKSWDAFDQAHPSRDGRSLQFYLYGSVPYSNAYWYKTVGGSKDSVNFLYDTWIAIDHSCNSQAVELDVNQSYNKERWVFGTQCNFKGAPPLGGYWNVWDGGTATWQPTKIPCTPAQFPADALQHVVWAVVRTGNYVRYNSLTLNGTEHLVDMQFGNQPNWPGSDIDVSVQLDGDASQQPYSVYIDEMNLTAW